MEDYTWLICFLPLLIILWEQHKKKRQEQQRRVLKRIRQRRKGQVQMNEALKQYIGKECYITTLNASMIGVIDAVEDNWLSLRADKENAAPELIQLDYIIHIRQRPLGKNGKKKSIW